MRYAIVLLFACGSSESKPPPPPATPPPPPAPSGCKTDGDCSLVAPERCVASPGHAATSCVCFERKCALRPSTPRISNWTCAYTADCDLDLATAQCGPGAGSDATYFTGPTCGCSPRDHRCQLHWFDPISCRTDDDCWLAEQPVLHAIPRPKRLKGRAFRGCVDGEVAPACVDARCTLRGLMC